MRSLRLVTRRSPLAMWQAEHVRDRLRAAHPGLAIEIIGVQTSADRFLDRPLAAIGGKGMFVKELEQALQDGSADLAVHSVKDVPMQLAAGLDLPVVLRREDARDALVGCSGLDALPRGARVGTSSLRRRCQLLHLRPDLRVVDLRGNVGTRLERLARGDFDALLLAAAGLARLGFDRHIGALLDPSVMLPAIGQGALGVECRADDTGLIQLLQPLADEDTRLCITAERAVNVQMYGSCHLPLAAHAVLRDGRLELAALVGRTDGSELLRHSASGATPAAAQLGTELGRALLAAGGAEILAQVHGGGN